MSSAIDGTEIEREWDIAWQAAGRRTFDWLRDADVPELAIFGGVQVIGLARIVTDRNGMYQPHSDGRPALIAPVAIAYVPDFEVRDLVAFCPNEPGKLYRRVFGDPVMNSRAISNAALDGAPLEVHGDVLSWLRAERRGCVVIDWRHAAEWLQGVQRFVCPNPATGRRLEEAFRWPCGRPDIRVSEARHAA